MKNSLRGQTVHRIRAQFCVCRFLDSRDKTIKENERTKEEQKERSCSGIRLQFSNVRLQFSIFDCFYS